MKIICRSSRGCSYLRSCSKKNCRKQTSIYAGTVFQNSRLSSSILLGIMYCFVAGFRAVDCERALYGDVRYKAIACWYGIYRDIMSAALISSTSDFKFTAGNVSVKTVENDESWFGKNENTTEAQDGKRH